LSNGAPLDAAAFDRFSVVAFGPPDVLEAVESLRGALPPSGRPILPGHVTVKGTFVDPLDLDEINRRIADCCAASADFALTAGRWQVRVDDEWSNCWLQVDDCPPMSRLHEALVAALAGLATTAYPGEAEGIYTPHLTLAQEFLPADADAARATLTAESPQFTFPVAAITLVGRRGGTAWETIRSYPLGTAASATA
jgi:2'-5' RNA ligase